MSFPTKTERQVCWDARDQYWECLDKNGNDSKQCAKLRQLYESNCPSQWVKHFDRKRTYLLFKEKVEKHGRSLGTNVALSPALRQRRPFKQLVFIDCTRRCSEIPKEVLEQALEVLLAVLINRRHCNDIQIVISTAYASVVACLFLDSEKIFGHFSNLLRENETQDVHIFLCHAVLQLNNSYWVNITESKANLLLEIFKVVENLCCELRSTTYLAFKVFYNLLCKIHQDHPAGRGVSSDSLKAMLNIVMSNWENPLTGVRQQNSLVLGQLLLFDKELWSSVLPEHKGHYALTLKHSTLLSLSFSQLSWSMKSKYFLLVAVLQKSDVSQILELHKEELVAGLMFSLSVPHLVSAGADLYRTVLAALSLQEWQNYFLSPFVSTLSTGCLSLQLENIFNYWMPHTLKQFPSITKDLLERSSLNLYSYITLYKIGRKEGLPCSSWEMIDNNKIKTAIEDYSDKIRIQAFSVVCMSSKTLVVPNNEEFELVKKFLKENVNSDNAALRQNVLNSFISFTVRIRDSLLKFIKLKTTNSDWILQCLSFLDWLHEFLVFNLENRTNYQRRMMSLELFKAILSYFGKPSERKDRSHVRKSNKEHLTLTNHERNLLWEFKFVSELSRKVLINCLFDEDNEIRSSSATILISYFDVHDSDYAEFKDLFQTALSLCSSQLFYKAEGGALLIKVLVTLALNSKSDKLRSIICNNGVTFVSVLLSSAEEQFQNLQNDLLKAAVEGSFLYGTLQALHLVLTDPDSPEFMMLNENQLKRLLNLLTTCTKYFIDVLSSQSNPDSDFAPSFGEMGVAIALAVENSSLHASDVIADDVKVDVTDVSAGDTSSDLHLTPAQQLVLSCVWLNIKECAKLSSKLVTKPLSVTDTERCVSLVVSVLRRCRHKGAIESAGQALCHIVRHITTSDNQELKSLPQQLLDKFLLSLVGNRASTVSRRSAGLAILVHRLITGDARPSKPLLHYSVARLLPIASDHIETDSDTLTDLPESQALHFLRTLVQESSLREPMAQYTLDISLVALNNLASPVWTIRNAALQLFGALVPKLVGQKPHQEDGKGHHHLAFEELYIRAKSLVEMMLSEFDSASSSTSTHLHSKLMPLLTLVTNLSIGLQAFVREDISNVVFRFRNYFMKLLKSKIFNVRKLSAKAHSLFLTPPQVFPVTMERFEAVLNVFEEKSECVLQSENELHGYLLNILFLTERLSEDKVGMNELVMQEKQIMEKLNVLAQRVVSSQCSCFVKAVMYELKNLLITSDLKKINLAVCQKPLGCSNFISGQVKQVIFNAKFNEIKEKVEFCLLENHNLDVQISCLKALNILLNFEREISFENSKCLSDLFQVIGRFVILNSISGEIFSLSLENMLQLLEVLMKTRGGLISCDDDLFCPKFLSYSTKYLSSTNTSSAVLSSLLPVVCGTLSNEAIVDLDTLRLLTSLIRSQSDPDYDQDIRVSAAKSMFFLVPILKSGKFQGTEAVENVWEACVTLLQDEVTVVRHEASRFVTTLVSNYPDRLWNPYLSLEQLFSYSLVTTLMRADQALECLWRQMITHFTPGSNCERVILNPFDHDVKSIYAEDAVVSNLAYKCILNLLTLHKSDLQNKVKQLCVSSNCTRKCSPKTLHYIQCIENSLNVNNVS